MKGIKILLLIVITPLILQADVIPSGKHIVHNCVKISNLHDYPEITLLGYIVGPSYDNPQFFEIMNKQCLEKGYKFNDLGLYWAQKKYIDSVGIENIVINTQIGPELYGDAYFRQVTNDPNIYFITSMIDPGDFWVDDFNHVKKQFSFYEIAGFIGTEIVLYLHQQTNIYRDDTQNVQIFELPEIPNLQILPSTMRDTSSSEGQNNN